MQDLFLDRRFCANEDNLWELGKHAEWRGRWQRQAGKAHRGRLETYLFSYDGACVMGHAPPSSRFCHYPFTLSKSLRSLSRRSYLTSAFRSRLTRVFDRDGWIDAHNKPTHNEENVTGVVQHFGQGDQIVVTNWVACSSLQFSCMPTLLPLVLQLGLCLYEMESHWPIAAMGFLCQ